MTGKPIRNPSIPYLGPLGTTIAPGNFIRIIGTVPSVGKEFFCNLQCCPSSYDDIAIHILVKLNEGIIVTKAYEFGSWIEENIFENSRITQGKEFEILIICELTVFKIVVNGQHLCEFPHKVPFHRISYVKIEGDLSVSQLSVENQPSAPSTVHQSPDMTAPPPPYGATTAPYPPMTSQPMPAQPMPPQPMPPQAPYALNSGQPPQTVMYATQPPPPGMYAYNALPQTTPVVAPLNATSGPYQRPFFSRPSGYGHRKMAYIVCGVYTIVVLIFLTVFLVVFFTMYNRHKEFDRQFEENRKKHSSGW